MDGVGAVWLTKSAYGLGILKVFSDWRRKREVREGVGGINFVVN